MSAVGYDLKFAAETIWKVAVASLILGAGLPVLYASGIRSLAWGSGGDSEVTHAKPNPIGKVLAAVIFVIVAYAIVSGIVYIIATGKGSDYDITFQNFIPEIQKKR
ncbi:MAG: hypothetical protein JWM76_2027 [Pseudonocardiales bacterium]|nr:hypothetical protein [Pseudonocardiales bacterium]